MESSQPTTAVPSENMSLYGHEKDTEKPSTGTLSRTPSTRSAADKVTGEKGIETTPLEEAEALDKLSDEPEYPSGSKLAVLTMALSLAVFLVALVGAYPVVYTRQRLIVNRTTRS